MVDLELLSLVSFHRSALGISLLPHVLWGIDITVVSKKAMAPPSWAYILQGLNPGPCDYGSWILNSYAVLIFNTKPGGLILRWSLRKMRKMERNRYVPNEPNCTHFSGGSVSKKVPWSDGFCAPKVWVNSSLWQWQENSWTTVILRTIPFQC